ncbi:MAG: hypothetical protein ACOC6H_04755 [Thermoproteota archaeon]
MKEVFRRKEVQQLLKALRNKEAKPSFTFEQGTRYPELEEWTCLTRTVVNSTLQKLHRMEILIVSQVDKNVVMCPECGVHRHMVHLSCPSCKSYNLEKGKMIEHLPCGHLDLEAEFRRGDRFICPKCEKPLKAIGVDYRRQDSLYKCVDCELITPQPEEEYTCSNQHTFQKEELKVEHISTYRINPSQQEVVNQHLIDFKPVLEEAIDLGWQGEVAPHIPGESGTKHRFAFSLWRQDRDETGEKRPKWVAELSTSQEETVDEERVLAFHAKALDVGSPDKILMVMPKLSESAKNLANSYRMKVVEAEEPEKLIEDTLKVIRNIKPTEKK